ncbi:MAG: DUF6088 family protein [Candidatus Omnitrophota bacterium]
MKTIKNKLLKRVRGKGRAWVFSDKDFIDFGTRVSIRAALMDLVNQGKIRRVIRGLYDYPKYSKTLDQFLSPDVNQVAQALARKFGWRIQPSGDTALNLLGLSTQVPGKMIFLSDGPNRTYLIGKTELVFEKTTLKNASLQGDKSVVVVQALTALKKDRVDDDVIKKIRSYLNERECEKVLRETRVVNGWIYDCIRSICQGKPE